MKLTRRCRYGGMIDWNWFFIFPAIVIISNEPQYYYKNLTLSLHWLGWHYRWQWVWEETYER